jgi:hypothetical protein
MIALGVMAAIHCHSMKREGMVRPVKYPDLALIVIPLE